MLPPGSPQQTASHFVHAILSSGDLNAAWAVTDEPLRRALAGGWVEANGRHTLIVRRGSAPVVQKLIAGDCFLWSAFAKATIAALRTRWADVDLETWGWAMNPRPATHDCDRVLLVNRAAAAEVDDAHVQCPAVEFLLRHDGDGWRVTGIGHGGSTPAG